MGRLIATLSFFVLLGAAMPVHHKWGHQHKSFDYYKPRYTCGELHTLILAYERKLNRMEPRDRPLSMMNSYHRLKKAFRSSCKEV